MVRGINSLIWIWCFCGLDLPFFFATNPLVRISRMSHGLLLQGEVMVLYVLSHPPFYLKRHQFALGEVRWSQSLC